MSRRGALARVTLLCVALACASGPFYPQVIATMPPPPPGQGRVVLYVTAATEVGGFHPLMTIDGQRVGALATGRFLIVDQPAGLHEVAVYVKPSMAAFESQGATPPVTVDVPPGGAAYVSVQAITGGDQIDVILRLELPANAQQQLATLEPVDPALAAER